MDASYQFPRQFPGTLIEPAPRVAQRRPSRLSALMDFYESAEDEEMEGDESEVDLMIQLSGMVGGTALAAEAV